MSTVDKKRASTAQLPAWQNFLFSTIAPQFAVLFTNPFDTAKVIVRMNIFASQIKICYYSSEIRLVVIYSFGQVDKLL
jgi:hypothetical protein